MVINAFDVEGQRKQPSVVTELRHTVPEALRTLVLGFGLRSQVLVTFFSV